MSPTQCRHVRRLMSEYDDGQAEDAAAIIQAHVATCSNCRQHWLALQRLSATLRASTMAQPSPHFTKTLMSRLPRPETRPLSALRPVSPAWAALATVSIVLVLVAMTALFSAAVAAGQATDAATSVDLVSLSMSVSGAVLRSASLAQYSLRAAHGVLGIIPWPLLLLALSWLITGTIALGVTVAHLVGRYQPAEVLRRVGAGTGGY